MPGYFPGQVDPGQRHLLPQLSIRLSQQNPSASQPWDLHHETFYFQCRGGSGGSWKKWAPYAPSLALVPERPCLVPTSGHSVVFRGGVVKQVADRSPRASKEFCMIPGSYRCTSSGHGRYLECRPEDKVVIMEPDDSASPARLVCCLRMSIRLEFREPACCAAHCAFDELSWPSRRLDDAASDDVV